MSNVWLRKKKFFLVKADDPTFSKRIYPLKVLEQVVKDSMPTIMHRGMLCHLDHQPDSVIRLANVSHIITDLSITPGHESGTYDLWAEIELLDTPNGVALKEMLLRSPDLVKFGMVGWGSGNINREGNLVVDESYKLITVNAVHADGKERLCGYRFISE